MTRIICLILTLITFVGNMFFFIEAAIKGGEILTLTGTHDTNQFMIMLVSLASMLTCVVLAYVVEKLINWENY